MRVQKFVGVMQAHQDDCVSACVASLLGVDLQAVPRFDPQMWGEQLNDWLEASGFSFINVRFPSDQKERIPRGYTIGAVASPSNQHPEGWMHCVICLDGMIVWDPLMGEQPGRERAEEYTIIYRLQPAIDLPERGA